MLSEPNVERLASTLCRLRGAALKVGQMLSFNNAELLPPALRTIMDRVRDGADVMPPWQLEQTMAQARGPMRLAAVQRSAPPFTTRGRRSSARTGGNISRPSRSSPPPPLRSGRCTAQR